MKVGILTFHRVPNVGAYLQCSSLVRVVRNLGHEAEVIDYAPPAQLQLSQPAFGRLVTGIYRNPRCAIGGLRSFWETLSHYRAARQDMATLPMGPRIRQAVELATLDYDRIILGSDEIWNAHNPLMARDLAYAGGYFKSQGLCAYAPSFGSVEDPSDLPSGMVPALAHIEHLSGRDENTVRLLSRIGLKSTMVLDPTLLGGRVLRVGPPAKTGGQIIIYGAPLAVSFLDALQLLAARERLNLFSIMHPQHPRIPHRSAVSAPKFLEQFRDARAIVTNTFHGTIFAVLSGKPFAVVSPGAKTNKITSLLRLLGSEDRLIGQVEHLPPLLNRPLDAEELDTRLVQASNTSFEFLKNALA